MRRGAPQGLGAVLIFLLLGSYVVYTQKVVANLRADAKVSSEMYRRVYRAFADTTPGSQDQALVDLSQSIVDQGVPLIILDLKGTPSAHANLPFDIGNQ